MFKMKRFALFSAFLFLTSFASSATMHVTFVSKDSQKSVTKADVSLKMDDKDISIAEFFAVDTASRDSNVLQHPAGRRQYILLIDFLHLSSSQVLEARKFAQDLVAQIPKEDLIAVAGITNEDGLRFFSGFTTDRSKLIAGWNAMGEVVLSGSVEGPEGNLYPSNFSMETAPIDLLSEEEFLTNLKTYAVDASVKDQLAPLYIQGLVDLSSLLSTMHGRKNVIFFSPGTDVKGLRVDLKELSKGEEKKEVDGQQDHKTLRELTQVGPRNLEAIAKEGPQTKRSRENDANVVARLIEGTDGHVYVFDPAAQDNNFLKDLAEKSKGAYKKMQEFASAIPLILTSDQSFYVVGWEGNIEKTFHELHTVELKALDAEIDAPLRWLAPKPVSDYSPLEKKAHVAEAIYKTFQTSDQHRFWSDIILDDGFNRVLTFTEVIGDTLLKTKLKELQIEFYGFAIEPDGTIVDFYNVPISLDLTNPKLKEKLDKAGLKVWNVLFAGRGPVIVRTVVLNTETGETITHSGRISFKDTDFLLSNPFFPSSNFDWVFWPKPDQTQNRRGKEIIYPYSMGNSIFAPELSPSMKAAEKGKVVYFKMYNFIPGDRYPSVRFKILGENGTSIEIDKFGLMQQPRLVQRGGVELFWTIETMPDLTKGIYRLQVDVFDRKQNKEVIRDVRTSVE